MANRMLQANIGRMSHLHAAADCLPDPPVRVGAELEALGGVEAGDGALQASHTRWQQVWKLHPSARQKDNTPSASVVVVPPFLQVWEDAGADSGNLSQKLRTRAAVERTAPVCVLPGHGHDQPHIVLQQQLLGERSVLQALLHGRR